MQNAHSESIAHVRPQAVLSNFCRALLPLLAVFALGNCGTGPQHSGSAPDGARHPLPSDVGGVPKTPQSSEPEGGHAVEGEVLYGDLGTHIFHRRDCTLLESVAEKDRIPFLSTFDGFDAGYFPCDDCGSGPR